MDAPTQGQNSIIEFLSDKSCEDIVGKGRGVLAIEGSASIDDLLTFLANKNILSAPVIDESGKFTGIIDVLDVVQFILKRLGNDFSTANLMDVQIEATTADIVDEAVSAYSAFIPADASAPAMEILKTFASSRFQRIVLFSSAKPSCSILCSQSDFLRFLHSSFSETAPERNTPLGVLLSSSLQSVGLVSEHSRKEIFGCKYGGSVIDGIQTISVSEMSGLPIVKSSSPSTIPFKVGPGDQIVGTFSASDLRSLTMEELSLLSEKMSEYQNAKHPHSLTRHATIQLTTEYSVQQIIEIFVSEHVHRIWILDGSTPVGVISLGDFLTWMFTYQQLSI